MSTFPPADEERHSYNLQEEVDEECLPYSQTYATYDAYQLPYQAEDFEVSSQNLFPNAIPSKTQPVQKLASPSKFPSYGTSLPPKRKKKKQQPIHQQTIQQEDTLSSSPQKNSSFHNYDSEAQKNLSFHSEDFACTMCPKCFPLQTSLTRHMSAKHFSIKVYNYDIKYL